MKYKLIILVAVLCWVAACASGKAEIANKTVNTAVNSNMNADVQKAIADSLKMIRENKVSSRDEQLAKAGRDIQGKTKGFRELQEKMQEARKKCQENESYRHSRQDPGPAKNCNDTVY